MNNTTTNAYETSDKAPTTLFANAVARVAIRATAPTLVAILSAVAVAVVFIVSSTNLRPNPFDPVGERSILERFAVQLDAPEQDAGREIIFVVEPREGEAISQRALDALYDKIDDCEILNPSLFGLDHEAFEREPARFLSATELDDAAQLATVAATLARGDPEPLELKAVVAKLAQTEDVDARFAFAQALDDVMRLPNPNHENIERPAPEGVEAREPQALRRAKFLIAQDGALALCQATTQIDPTREDDETFASAVDAITTEFRNEFPGLDVVATGAIPLQNDDLTAATRASIAIGAAFLVGVALLAWTTFARISRAVILLVATLTPTVCALGLYALTGVATNPNVAFGVFATATLALICAAVYLAQYAATRESERSVSAALLATTADVASPLACVAALACALGAALAFASVELRSAGLALAIGAPTAWLATIAIMPTLLQLADAARPLKEQGKRVDLTLYFAPITRRARMTITLAAIATILCASAIAKTQFQTTRLRFLPNDSSARAALMRATAALGFNPTLRAVVRIDALEDANALKRRFEEDQTLVLFAPENAAPTPERLIKISATRDALVALQTTLPELEPPAYEDLDEPLQLLANAAKDEDAGAILLAALERAAIIEPQERDARLAILQRVYAVETLKRLFLLRDLLTRQPDESDANARAQEMLVYSTKDLDRAANLAAFVGNLMATTPRVTGSAPRAFQRMQTANILRGAVACFAFLAVLIVVAIRARSTLTALAVVAPCLAAYLAALGIAAWLQTPLSVETIALSILALTLAADSARRVDRNDRATAATTIVAATLAIAFCTALAATEQGWREFARVGVIVAALYFVATAIVIPAALKLVEEPQFEVESCDRKESITSK